MNRKELTKTENCYGNLKFKNPSAFKVLIKNIQRFKGLWLMHLKYNYDYRGHKDIMYIPVNTIHFYSIYTMLFYNIYTMLDQRRRRWVDVV